MSGQSQFTNVFRRFNAFGWATCILAVVACVTMMFEIGGYRWFTAREPSVWRFGLEVALLMLDVPLGLAAWKAVRRSEKKYGWDRVMVASWVLISFVYVLESRFAHQNDETLRPHIPLMIFWTLLFANMAWGRRPDPAVNTLALNNQAGMAKDPAGVI